MKQGSADDPFAEDSADGDESADESGQTSAERAGPSGDSRPLADAESAPAERQQESAPTSGDTEAANSDAAGGPAVTDRERASSDRESARSETPQRQSLPYIHARDGVKDGRTQRPVFLRDPVESGIDELVAEVETELGEDVYKTDVTEAAMVVAQENPELVLAKLEEWGYGWT